MRSRTVGLALAGGVAGLLLAGAAWWVLREPPVHDGPTEVPMGQTLRQALPGPDGEREVWTLMRREATEADHAPPDLPEPAPEIAPEPAAREASRTLDARALEAWKHGEIEQALGLFEEAIAADPNDWLPRSNYGRLLTMMTVYDRAGPHLEKAAELNPDSPRVWLDLLSYYERTLDLTRSIPARRRAQELAGSEPIVQDETGLYRLESDRIFP